MRVKLGEFADQTNNRPTSGWKKQYQSARSNSSSNIISSGTMTDPPSVVGHFFPMITNTLNHEGKHQLELARSPLPPLFPSPQISCSTILPIERPRRPRWPKLTQSTPHNPQQSLVTCPIRPVKTQSPVPAETLRYCGAVFGS